MWDVKLFMIGVLISSVFIYNTKTPLGTDALNKLGNVSSIAEKIKLKANSSEVYNKKHLRHSCPDFVWIVRDNALNLIESPQEQLEEFLEIEDDSTAINKKAKQDILSRNQTRENIIDTFHELKCFYLPLPLSNSIAGLSIEESYTKLNDLSDTELNPKFINELKNIKEQVINKISAKMINNTVLNGNMFVEYLKLIVDMVNKQKTVYIQDAMEKIQANEIFNQIKKRYVDEVNEKLKYGTLFKNNEFGSFLNEVTQKYVKELQRKVGKIFIEEYEEMLNSFMKEENEKHRIKNKERIKDHNMAKAKETWRNEIEYRINYIQSLSELDNMINRSKTGLKSKVIDLSDYECNTLWEELMRNVNYELVRRNIKERLDEAQREKERTAEREKLKQLELENTRLREREAVF